MRRLLAPLLILMLVLSGCGGADPEDQTPPLADAPDTPADAPDTPEASPAPGASPDATVADDGDQRSDQAALEARLPDPLCGTTPSRVVMTGSMLQEMAAASGSDPSMAEGIAESHAFAESLGVGLADINHASAFGQGPDGLCSVTLFVVDGSDRDRIRDAWLGLMEPDAVAEMEETTVDGFPALTAAGGHVYMIFRDDAMVSVGGPTPEAVQEILAAVQ